MTRRSLLSALGLLFGNRLLARPRQREVLAFYYGWYGNPQVTGQWLHWPEGTAHQPQLGRYDSHDPKVIDTHFAQAKAAGITGLIVSWWRAGDFQDQGMPLLLTAAERAGLKITLYYEVAKPRESPTPQATTAELLDLLARYANHPAWLRSEAKPVVFVYSRAVNELKLAGWEQVISELNRKHAGGVCIVGDQISRQASKVFTGLHAYNPTGQTANLSVDQIRGWARANFPWWIATARGGISCVTVIPGYDDTRLNRSGPRPTTGRHDGETYRVLWQEAIAANPDWILITSWNEWHEGSEIEPSQENGDRELNTTREFARKFVS